MSLLLLFQKAVAAGMGTAAGAGTAAGVGNVGATSFRWVYSLDAFATAGVPITTSSDVIRAVAAVSFADGDDVPGLLGSLTGYVADNNAASEDGTFSLTAAMPASGVFEAVLSFQRLSPAAIQIRLERGDGTAFTTYANVPSLAPLGG